LSLEEGTEGGFSRGVGVGFVDGVGTCGGGLDVLCRRVGAISEGNADRSQVVSKFTKIRCTKILKADVLYIIRVDAVVSFYTGNPLFSSYYRNMGCDNSKKCHVSYKLYRFRNSG